MWRTPESVSIVVQKPDGSSPECPGPETQKLMELVSTLDLFFSVKCPKCHKSVALPVYQIHVTDTFELG